MNIFIPFLIYLVGTIVFSRITNQNQRRYEMAKKNRWYATAKRIKCRSVSPNNAKNQVQVEWYSRYEYEVDGKKYRFVLNTHVAPPSEMTIVYDAKHGNKRIIEGEKSFLDKCIMLIPAIVALFLLYFLTFR